VEKVVIVGANNAGKLVLDIIFKRRYMLLEEIHVLGFIDEDASRVGEFIHGVEVIGNLEAFLEREFDETLEFIVACENVALKKTIIQMIESRGYHKFYIAIHPRAIVGNNVMLGVGSVVHSGAIINIDTDLGEHVVVGAGSMIEIGTTIKDYVVIRPKVIIGEDVYIGSNVLLKAGTIVDDYVKIPKGYISKLGEIIK
jgi:acetyltransferase-like isoleucine patch superfamily enzyme